MLFKKIRMTAKIFSGNGGTSAVNHNGSKQNQAHGCKNDESVHMHELVLFDFLLHRGLVYFDVNRLSLLCMWKNVCLMVDEGR